MDVLSPPMNVLSIPTKGVLWSPTDVLSTPMDGFFVSDNKYTVDSNDDGTDDGDEDDDDCNVGSIVSDDDNRSCPKIRICRQRWMYKIRICLQWMCYWEHGWWRGRREDKESCTRIKLDFYCIFIFYVCVID
ncbi:hypothetical protein Drorol1_Dr00005949 [Drosera rotundifolia]